MGNLIRNILEIIALFSVVLLEIKSDTERQMLCDSTYVSYLE